MHYSCKYFVIKGTRHTFCLNSIALCLNTYVFKKIITEMRLVVRTDQGQELGDTKG